MLTTVKDWARRIKRDLVALYIAGRDRRTPILARLLAICVVAYALSPIDLIPDFIPVIGLLDDLILVPLGLAVAMRLIPPPLMATFRQQATEMGRLGKSGAAAVVVVSIWLAVAMIGVLWIWRA